MSNLPTVSYDPTTIKGWRELGVSYTCVPDTLYPWDPTVLKMIWDFAPDTIPIWVQWVFQVPLEDADSYREVVFGRHALGRRIVIPNAPLPELKVTMPTMPVLGVTFDKPNSIWFVHDGAPDPRSSALPGGYLGFDDTILDRAKQSVIGRNMTQKEFEEYMWERYVLAPQRRAEARKAAIEDDLAYRGADFEKYAKKQIERISDVEAKEYLAGQGATP